MKKSQSQIIIYTDGACSGNPGPGGWGAILCLVSSEGQAMIKELGGFGGANTTNNAMELQAVVTSLNEVNSETPIPDKITLATDSRYVLNGVQWMKGWKKNGWKTAQGKTVANESLWKELYQLIEKLGDKTHWVKVAAHQGHPANERADSIAVEFSTQSSPRLFHGKLSESGFRFNDFDSKQSSQSSSKGYPVYLSYIDGQLQEHSNWNECESRVHGKSGAKFKKVKNPAEKKAILSQWGIK